MVVVVCVCVGVILQQKAYEHNHSFIAHYDSCTCFYALNCTLGNTR